MSSTSDIERAEELLKRAFPGISEEPSGSSDRRPARRQTARSASAPAAPDDAPLPLFNDAPAPVHHEPHDTELEAALSIDTGRLQERVLRLLDAGDGLTDTEIERALNLARPTGGNRRLELVKKGFVEDSGKCRPSLIGGKSSIVWSVTALGRAAARKSA